MDPAAMEPLGLAMKAFLDGDTGAQLVLCRDDGHRNPIPVSLFFRDTSQSTRIDRKAIDLCQGHVLDVGAGSGLHSIVLQGRGVTVTSIDISPWAVEIMKERGVRDARRADMMDLQSDAFDTLLMMGHGIGMVETIAGLDRFLGHAHALVKRGGGVLLDSLDVRNTNDASHLAYQEANRRAGRYVGEIRFRLGVPRRDGTLLRLAPGGPRNLERACPRFGLAVPGHPP
jgi:SAM-dependent methyltransferase